MRTLLRTALSVSVLAGALFAVLPAHAQTACTNNTADGAGICHRDGSGANPPSGTRGDGESTDSAPPAPAPGYVTPVPAPAVPAPVPDAPAPGQETGLQDSPADRVAPAEGPLPYVNADAPVAPVEAAAPADSPVPVVEVPVETPAGFPVPPVEVPAGTPAEFPVPAAEAPAAGATPSATASATTSQPTSTGQTEPPPAELQGGQTSMAGGISPAPFVIGILSVLLIAGAAWYWRRTGKPRAGAAVKG